MKRTLSSLIRALGIRRADLAEWLGFHPSQLSRLSSRRSPRQSPGKDLLRQWLWEWDILCIQPLPHTVAEPPFGDYGRHSRRLCMELEIQRIRLRMEKNKTEGADSARARVKRWLEKVLALPETRSRYRLVRQLEALQKRIDLKEPPPPWRDAYRELETRHLDEKIAFLKGLEP